VDDLDAAGVAVEVGLAGFSELDRASFEGEEGVVAANADVLASENAGAALAHEDRARLGLLTIIQFRAQVLWV